MSTKYSVSERTRWTFHGFPRLTDHAADRWDERTPRDAVAPETAFEEGMDVSEVRDKVVDKGGQQPDQVVYWYERTNLEAYGILFIVRDDVIKTVYRAEWINDEPTQAYLQAHNQEFCHE